MYLLLDIKYDHQYNFWLAEIWKKNLLLRNQWRFGQVTDKIAQFCRITMDKMKKKFDFGGLTPPIHEKGVQCVKCCFHSLILFPLDQPSYFIAMFICRKFWFLGIPVSLIIRIEAQKGQKNETLSLIKNQCCHICIGGRNQLY